MYCPHGDLHAAFHPHTNSQLPSPCDRGKVSCLLLQNKVRSIFTAAEGLGPADRALLSLGYSLINDSSGTIGRVA